MPQVLYLVRGLPGAGKSTLAAKLAPIVREADQYFVHDGVYNYDPSRISLAHADCLARTRDALETGQDVAVANTFVRRWELQPYRDLAATMFPDVSVVEVSVVGRWTPEELAARTVHHVPAAKIGAMRAAWEWE